MGNDLKNFWSGFNFDSNGEFDLRIQFIHQMKNFATTIQNSPAGDNIATILTPFLSMAGLTNLIPKLDKNNIVTILNEAATVVQANPSAESILFGYYLDGMLTLTIFNFKDANLCQKQISLNISAKELAGEIFLAKIIKDHIMINSKEMSCIPLCESTGILCGIKI